MKQYTISDIKALQERQQAAHRGRSIYSDMRSTSEERFRNALEREAMPLIEEMLGMIKRQHEALKEAREEGYQVDEAITLAEPFIETHQSRIRREEGRGR